MALASAKRVASSTPCLIVFLTPWGGRRCPSALSPAATKPRTSPPSTPALRASRFQPWNLDPCYLARTSNHRPDYNRLFVTTGRTKKEISKNTVSFWLRRVISLAYQLSGKPLPATRPLARETSGIGPSLLFKKNYAVSQVLKAGTWRRHHLHAPLPQGLGTQVPRHLPPVPRGGGSGHGITWPLTPGYLTLTHDTP